MAKKNFKPCMLAAFKKEESQNGEALTQPPIWSVRYCVASPTFKTGYFQRISGSIPPEIAATITQPGRDIAASETMEVSVTWKNGGGATQFTAE